MFVERGKVCYFMAKKLDFDICGGNCAMCDGYCAKDFSSQTVISKKKVATKYVAPDMVAIKLMIERDEKQKDIGAMTDAELKALEKELLGKFDE